VPYIPATTYKIHHVTRYVYQDPVSVCHNLAHLMPRRRAKQARDLPVLGRHEHDAPWMPPGVGHPCAMASAATPHIDDAPMQALGIHRLRDSGRTADRQDDPECHQREIAVE